MGTKSTHGHSLNYRRSPTYRTWQNMIQRCTNPNIGHYKNYGGRGITVCDEWRTFDNFLREMGERPEGTTLDRINNDGSYCKENCKWSNRHEQMANSRMAHLITFRGETLPTAVWARRLGISRASLRNRLKKWTLEKALITPKPKSTQNI